MRSPPAWSSARKQSRHTSATSLGSSRYATARKPSWRLTNPVSSAPAPDAQLDELFRPMGHRPRALLNLRRGVTAALLLIGGFYEQARERDNGVPDGSSLSSRGVRERGGK